MSKAFEVLPVMAKRTVISLVIVIAGLALAWVRPSSTLASPTDVWIEATIRGNYLRPTESLFDVEVEVVDQVVTLSGTVSSRRERVRAEEIASSLQSVRRVVNNVEVDPAFVPSTQDEDAHEIVLALEGSEQTVRRAGSSIIGGFLLEIILSVTAVFILFVVLARRKRREDQRLEEEFQRGPRAKTYYNLDGYVNSIQRRHGGYKD